MSKRTFTNEQFIEAVKLSTSLRQILTQLNLKEAGGNYKTIKNLIIELNLDTSHHTGQLWSKGKTLQPKRNIEDYFNNTQKIQSHTFKLRLIKEGYKSHQCEICLLKEWNNLPIPIELDHIDGNHLNNNLSNLRILCPNCHAQTDTYRGKNIKYEKKESLKELTVLPKIKPIIQKPTTNCLICNIAFKIKSGCPNNYCSQECSHKSQQKNEYSKELIIQLLIKYQGNLVQSSKELNISDNGLRKWCKKYNLNPKDYK